MIGVLLAFAILLCQIHFGVIPKDLTARNFVSIALPYAVLLGVVVILAIVNAPVKLDATRENECSGLRKQVVKLTPPKRTPEQEQKYSEVKTALDEIGPNAIPVLRHLEIHGSLKFDGLVPPLPNGISARDTKTILDICADHAIVTRVSSSRPSGGVAPINEYTYSIPVGIVGVLLELLYAPRSADAT